MDENIPEKNESQILIYKTESGKTKLEVRLVDETVWLTQRLLAELFQVGVNTINYHIKEIYNESELLPEATIRKFRIVQQEGKREVSRTVDFYNLDMIISVGYRVKSYTATHFRQWATQRLREYIVKGFTMDDERLKEGVNMRSCNFFLPDPVGVEQKNLTVKDSLVGWVLNPRGFLIMCQVHLYPPIAGRYQYV